MTKLDATAEMTLEYARAAREPSAADRARNLAALRARLGVVPLMPGEPAAVGAPLAPRALAAAPARSLLPRVLGAALVSGVVGFWIGSGRDHALAERAPGVPAAPTAAVALADPVARAPAPDPVVRAAPLAQVDATSTAEVPAAREAREPAKSRASKPAHASAVRARPAESNSGFLAAVRLLRRAQRAVRTGDAAVASSLLDQLDERFSSEVLQEERQATRALCWCASGDVERAHALARDLLEQNPRSIYARRLQQSCAGRSLAPAVSAPLAPARR